MKTWDNGLKLEEHNQKVWERLPHTELVSYYELNLRSSPTLQSETFYFYDFEKKHWQHLLKKAETDIFRRVTIVNCFWKFQVLKANSADWAMQIRNILRSWSSLSSWWLLSSGAGRNKHLLCFVLVKRKLECNVKGDEFVTYTSDSRVTDCPNHNNLITIISL